MSERLGIDRSYLAEIETGKIEVCLRNLALIAEAFEMQAWQLMKFRPQHLRFFGLMPVYSAEVSNPQTFLFRFDRQSGPLSDHHFFLALIWPHSAHKVEQ